MRKSALIFITGPTAVGKSAVSLHVARHFHAEIVCCDALQVYQEVSIASDKPSAKERAAVAHHVVDVVSVTEDFNVALWRQLALAAIKDIQGRGKIPVIVGGSGMYMSVLLDGIFEVVESPGNLNDKFSKELETIGSKALYDRLKNLDPKAAAKIHPNDPQRILRALKVVSSTGKPISQLQRKREGLWGKIPIRILGLNRPRQELYQRVEARIDEMFDRGLVKEIKHLSSMALSRTAAKIIGIPEVSGYLKDEYDLERAKYLMKLHTRHYVKRQLTWFRAEKRLEWIDLATAQSPAQAAEMIIEKL